MAISASKWGSRLLVVVAGGGWGASWNIFNRREREREREDRGVRSQVGLACCLLGQSVGPGESSGGESGDALETGSKRGAVLRAGRWQEADYQVQIQHTVSTQPQYGHSLVSANILQPETGGGRPERCQTGKIFNIYLCIFYQNIFPTNV